MQLQSQTQFIKTTTITLATTHIYVTATISDAIHNNNNAVSFATTYTLPTSQLQSQTKFTTTTTTSSAKTDIILTSITTAIPITIYNNNDSNNIISNNIYPTYVTVAIPDTFLLGC